MFIEESFIYDFSGQRRTRKYRSKIFFRWFVQNSKNTSYKL